MDRATRESWHCGWLPTEDWRPCELPPHLGARGHEVDLHELGICPGWLTRQQAVQECIQANVALQHGEFRTFFPGEQASLLEGALLSQQAFNLYEFHQLRKSAGGRG